MHTDTIVIGAGQAGLAVSAELTRHGREHLVLERGRVAERWRSERWDSLHLLTPNWMTRLPGHGYAGDDPDGFMSASALAGHLAAFARLVDAPVLEETTVVTVDRDDHGFRVQTDQGALRADHVVVATGWCDRPSIPPVSAGLPSDVSQLTPSSYRNPGQVPAGGVLVVGASASGAQIADELARSGRDVVLAVGRHTPVPRRYRGRDVMWWLEQLGALDRVPRSDAELELLRREPSLQLVGGAGDRRVDLATLQDRGVRLVGRLTGIDGTTARFADTLAATVGRAGQEVHRLLRRMDDLARRLGIFDLLPGPEPDLVRPVRTVGGVDHLDLRAAGVRTVVWATGYRRVYPWLRVPVLDAAGEILQRRGVTPVRGLYTAGMRFQTSRRSTFVDGARFDAAAVVGHLVGEPADHPSVASPDRPARALAAA